MEPLSAFSLSLAILNIFLNTIAGVYGKVDEIVSYKDKLMKFKRTLNDCSVSFQLWFAIWERKATGDTAFQILFGPQGWEEVKASKLALEGYIERLQRHLCLKEPPEQPISAKQPPKKLSKKSSKQTASQPDQNGNVPMAAAGKHPWSSFGALFRSKSKASKQKLETPLSESVASVNPSLEPTGPEALISVAQTAETLAPNTLAPAPGTPAPEMAIAADRASKPTDPAVSQQIQVWAAYTDNIGTWSQAQPDPSIVKRVIGILGPNQRLDRLVADLKEEIDRLHRLSANHYRRMGHGKEGPKQAEDLEPTLRKFSFWDLASKISSSGSPFHQKDESLNSGWYLELHFPENIADSKILINQIITYCRFRFMVKTKSSSGQRFVKEVRVLQRQGHFKGSKAAQEDVKEALSDLFLSNVCNFKLPSSMEYQLKALYEPKLWTKDWQALLVAGAQDSTIKQAFALERARLAYGFVIWMILLWNTSWFTHICSCAFRCVLFQETEQSGHSEQLEGPEAAEGQPLQTYRRENVYLAAKMNEAVENDDNQDAAGSQRNCHHSPSTNDRLYLCGRLLAELLLAEPVKVEEDPDDLYWRIETNVPGEAWMAVRFCFQNGDNDPWNKSSSYLATGQIETLLDEVIKPIQVFYESARNHFPKSNAKNFVENALAQADASFD